MSPLPKACATVQNDNEKVATSSGNVIDMLKEMLQHVQKDDKKELENELLRVLIEGSSTKGATLETGALEEKEVHDFISVMRSEIDNLAHKLDGNPNQVRFHPMVMKLAFNLYQRSPAAYADVQKSTVTAMPSASTMKRKKRAEKVQDGRSFTIYALHKFEFDEYNYQYRMRGRGKNARTRFFGRLLCDEMKIKSGLVWRTSSHEFIGFASINGCTYPLMA